MILDNRLKGVEELTLPDLGLADIGTDHAKLPRDLLQKNLIPYALATDISPKVIGMIRNYESDKLILKCSSGIKEVDPEKYRQIVIAGMGGELIAKILAEDPEKAKSFKKLILQPMKKSGLLRDFLASHGFTIIEEIVVKSDQKFYEILSASPGEMKLSYMDDEIGYHKARRIDETYLEFLLYKISIYQKRIDQMKRSENPEVSRKRKDFLKRLDYLKNYANLIQNYQNHRKQSTFESSGKLG